MDALIAVVNGTLAIELPAVSNLGHGFVAIDLRLPTPP
jgi:hypothetical protein